MTAIDTQPQMHRRTELIIQQCWQRDEERGREREGEWEGGMEGEGVREKGREREPVMITTAARVGKRGE